MSRRLPADLARRIRLVILDVDGVLTDNGVYIGQAADGQTLELKRFNILDGLGIKMLRWGGIPVILVSGRESPASKLRADELEIECYQEAGGRKLPTVRRLLEQNGLAWEEVAFVGDDLADLPVLQRVGLPVAVANAVAEVRAAARWQTQRPGGEGAVREFAEALLQARGEWAGLVEEYRRAREEGEEDA